MKNILNISFKTEVLPVLLVIISVIASFYFFQQFPEQVPIHWNFAGEVDDYSGRAFAAFFFPGMILGTYLLMLLFPHLDPKKDRYKDFSKVYHIAKGLIVLILTVLYFSTSLFAMGYNIPIGHVVSISIGVMLILLGNYFGKIKRNWMFGIRTPWTLSSEETWNKTHRFGGYAFMGAGLIIALTSFLPVNLRAAAFLVAILAAIVPTVIYSYLVYRKEVKK